MIVPPELWLSLASLLTALAELVRRRRKAESMRPPPTEQCAEQSPPALPPPLPRAKLETPRERPRKPKSTSLSAPYNDDGEND